MTIQWYANHYIVMLYVSCNIDEMMQSHVYYELTEQIDNSICLLA